MIHTHSQVADGTQSVGRKKCPHAQQLKLVGQRECRRVVLVRFVLERGFRALDNLR